MLVTRLTLRRNQNSRIPKINENDKKGANGNQVHPLTPRSPSVTCVTHAHSQALPDAPLASLFPHSDIRLNTRQFLIHMPIAGAIESPGVFVVRHTGVGLVPYTDVFLEAARHSPVQGRDHRLVAHKGPEVRPGLRRPSHRGLPEEVGFAAMEQALVVPESGDERVLRDPVRVERLAEHVATAAAGIAMVVMSCGRRRRLAVVAATESALARRHLEHVCVGAAVQEAALVLEAHAARGQGGLFFLQVHERVVGVLAPQLVPGLLLRLGVGGALRVLRRSGRHGRHRGGRLIQLLQRVVLADVI